MQFHSNPIDEHNEVPLADEGRWEQLIDHFARRATRVGPGDTGQNACYVVSVTIGRDTTSAQARLDEILGLVRAQGDRVVGYEMYRRPRPDKRTFVGRGAADELAARAAQCGADMLVLDAELSPSQTRNLEDATSFPICDREAVILNVFSRHARTRKARIQVEIAHLEYLRPRIRGLGLEMDQQAGGVLAGRGPGETASELLARQLDGRLAELRKAFHKLRRAGKTQRKGRDGCKRIALVGYTNAGKTSLMNALTAAQLSAKNLPFETLDTTSRCLTRHGGDVLLSDTVGFIRRLPERLLASFESTLAEIREADLLALVVDASDPEWTLHLQTTEALLVKLKADEIPRFYVFNKRDRIPTAPDAELLGQLSGGHGYMLVSSRDVEAIGQLGDAFICAARKEQGRVQIFVPYAAAALINRVYATCRVIESESTEAGMQFTIEGTPHVVARLQRESEEVQV